MSENHRESGVFHIRDAADFFYLLENAPKRYNSTPAKSIELLLFLIMGLNHLREWIALEYKVETDPKNRAKRFCVEIWKTMDFQTTREICNETPPTPFRSLHNL